MSALEPNKSPEPEEIHLPGPSIEPLLITVGLTATLLGVTFHPAVLVFGLALTLWQSIKWIRETREEIAELPAHHH